MVPCIRPLILEASTAISSSNLEAVMYSLPPPPQCAPYLVFENDRLVGRALDLVSLHALLCARQEHWAKTIQREPPVWGSDPRSPGFGAALPVLPHRKVIDARGVERGEFCSPGRMLAFFGCPPDRLHRMVDPGWDGDHRPRGRPIPGTGRRSSYSQASRPGERVWPVNTSSPVSLAGFLAAAWAVAWGRG